MQLKRCQVLYTKSKKQNQTKQNRKKKKPSVQTKKQTLQGNLMIHLSSDPVPTCCWAQQSWRKKSLWCKGEKWEPTNLKVLCFQWRSYFSCKDGTRQLVTSWSKCCGDYSWAGIYTRLEQNRGSGNATWDYGICRLLFFLFRQEVFKNWRRVLSLSHLLNEWMVTSMYYREMELEFCALCNRPFKF